MASVVEDVASASNVHHFQVQSYDISLVLDLDKQHACGSVKVQVNRTQEASKTLILDSYHLNIHRVTVCSSNETLPFKIEPFTGFGSALHIDTKTVEGNSFELEIEYSTVRFQNSSLLCGISSLDLRLECRIPHREMKDLPFAG